MLPNFMPAASHVRAAHTHRSVARLDARLAGRSWFRGEVAWKLALSLLLLAFATLTMHAAAVQFSPTTIGTQSTQSVQVMLPQGGTIARVRVLTSGVEGQDFTTTGSAGCAAGATVAAAGSCSVPVLFQPVYPGMRYGAVVLTDATNAVLGVTWISGTANGPLGRFLPGTIQTVAGDAEWNFGGDGLLATSSPIFLPFGVAVDGGGNLFIADSTNNRIRRVDAGTQIMTTVAGSAGSGTQGDNGPATSAQLSLPTSVAVDGAGNIYFSDSSNNAVRRIDAFTGVLTTVAGVLGNQGYDGDNGPGKQAHLNGPNGIALDNNGGLYIADTGNNVVRFLNLTSGVMTAFAGNHSPLYAGDGGPATSASLYSPWGVTLAANGDVYIADQKNHAIRKVSAGGTISTFAGNGISGASGDGGAPSGALLNHPAAVAIDVAGNIYIADAGNNRIRKVNAASNVITTVVGSATEGFGGDGGPADKAAMYGPYGIAIDTKGNLLIADVLNNRIRMVSADKAVLNYAPIRVRRVSGTQNQQLENDGNAPLNIAALQAGTNTQVDAVATTCTTANPVATSTTCLIGAQFAPTVTGNPVQGTIQVNSDSPNSPQPLTLQGTVLTLDPSTIVLTTSGSPSANNAPVTFTATVTGVAVPPTGMVTFYDGSTAIGMGTLANEVATFTTAALSLGSHPITADYNGDTNNAPVVSSTVTQLVKNGTTVQILADYNPANWQQTVTLTATANNPGVVPTGTVTFLDGTTVIGTAALSAVSSTASSAVLMVSSLSVGTHGLKTSYPGDTNALGNVSGVLQEVVRQVSTTTTLGTSNADATFSNPVVLTASVQNGTGVQATGTVTFTEGAVTLGTASLDGSGNAVLTLSTLGVGAHSIKASYAGDGNDVASASNSLSQTIEKIPTVTLLTSGASTVSAGAVVHLTATVTGTPSPGAYPLTGSVTFTEGATTLGTATIAAGSAKLDVSSLPIGSHSIVATYNGATYYAASTSIALTQQVQQGTSSGTLTGLPLPAVAGYPLGLTATFTSGGSTPTGSVVFRDGTTVLGSGTLSAGVVTFSATSLGVGSHSLTATYNGDTNNQGSTASLTVSVNQAITSTALTSTGASSVYGLPVTLLATVTLVGNGGTPGGPVTFYDGVTAIGSGSLSSTGVATLVTTSLGIASHSLSAVYAGDANDRGSTSNTYAQQINKTTTATSVSSSSLNVSQGTQVTLAATVTANAGTPGGLVQFFDGSTLLGTATLNAAGVTSFQISNLTPGQHNIVAVFPGDATNGSSTSAAIAQTVNPITIVGLTSDHNPASSGAAVIFTAGVSGATTIPTGLVTFKEGSAVLGVVTLNAAGVATLQTTTLTAGAHTLIANYAGDASNPASVSQPYTQNIQQATTQTTLSAGSATAAVGSTVNLSVVVNGSGGTPTGLVSILDGSAPLGTANLSNGTASLSTNSLALGVHTLTAVYAGDTADAGSTSTVQTLTIAKGTVTITTVSSADPSNAGASVALTASVRAISGTPTGTVAWSDGGAALGTTGVGTNGTSILTISTLAPGTHTILAVYSGDGAFNAATASPLAQTVQQGSSTTVLVSNHTPALTGVPLTLSVNVTGAGSQPGGTVTIKDGGVAIGTITLDNSGSGSLTVSSLAAGTHALVASYPGDTNHTASQSATLTQQVDQATSATALTTSKNPATVGDLLSFAVSVSGSGNQPVGSASIRDNGVPIGSVTLDGGGNGVFTSSTLSVGTHALTAVYSGDTAHPVSQSAVLAQEVDKAGSSITLVSSRNPAAAGEVITWTMTVSVPTGTGAPTGPVVLKDSGAVLATLTPNASGILTFQSSTLGVSPSHTLVANFLGDTNHTPSQSASVVQVIEEATSTTTLVSDHNPALTGQAVTYSVVVTGSTGTPSGRVVLQDNGAPIGTPMPLDSSGHTSFVLSDLLAGQHSLVAVYGGDSNHSGSQSGAVQEVIQQVTSLTLISSKPQAIVNDQITLTVHLTGTNNAASVVAINDGATTLATVALDGLGNATYSTSSLTVGTHPLMATYAGDATHAASQSTTLQQRIISSASTTTLVSNGTPALVGAPVVLTVAVTGGGAVATGNVTLKDGAAVLATVPLTNGGASFPTSSLAPGIHTLTAVYAGDVNLLGSASAGLTQQILQPTSVAVVSSKNPSNGGESVVFTGNVTGGAASPTGTLVFHDGAAVLTTVPVGPSGTAAYAITTLTPGQHNISVNYSGDDSNQTSVSNVVVQVVQSNATTTTLARDVSAATVGTAITLSAQVGGGSVGPTGTVTFLDGANTIGTSPVSAGGLATLTVNTLGVGEHILLAIYGGDVDHLTSTSNPLLQAIQLRTTTLVTSNTNPSLIGDGVTFNITVLNSTTSPLATGTVTLLDGTNTLATGVLSSSGTAIFTVPALTVGKHAISAAYAGDSQNFASSSATLTQVVGLRPSTNVLTASTTTAVAGTQFTLTATVGGNGPVAPGGPVTFSAGGTTLGTAPLNASGVATLTVSQAIGTYAIVSIYPGDGIYSGSQSAPVTVNVIESTHFTIDLAPPTMTLSRKQHSTLQITLTSIQGFADNLALGCVGLPQAATCTFSTDHSQLTADGKQVVSLTVDTGSPLVAGGAAPTTAQNRVGPGTMAMCLLPGGLLLVFAMRKNGRRSRMLGGLLAMLLLGIVSTALTGCGSLDVNGTPTGTYKFQVTAIGATTAATESAQMTLTVN